MSQTCKDRCVGKIISSSLAINGMPHNQKDQQAIQDCLPKEIQKAQKLQEEYQADLKAGKVAPPTPADAQQYQKVEAAMADPAKRADIIDHSVMCSVSCCCNKHPNKSSKNSDLMQKCVESVLKEADKKMNFKSRYKAEVGYDMQIEGDGVPTPFMHRDKDGNNTMQTSTFPIGRRHEIQGYKPGLGYLRIPDVVIVSDPEKPPTVDSIDKVMEIKNRDDKADRMQDRAYTKIAGGMEKYHVYRVGGKPQNQKEQLCNCNDPVLPVKNTY